MKFSSHYKQVWVGIGCLFASLFSTASRSESVQDLYQVRVVVEDQSEANRNAAFAQALKTLIVRLAGNAAATNSAQIKQMLKKPGKFVQQFSYLEIPQVGSTTKPGMQVQFDEEGVNQILQSQGLPLWGKERPLTLVVLVIKEDDTKRILASGEPSDLRLLLDQAAVDRGTPILLPLMDLSDQTAGMDAEKIWGGKFDGLQALRIRYDAEGILIGNLKGFPKSSAPEHGAAGGGIAAKSAIELPPATEAADQTEIRWTYLQGESAPASWSSAKANAILQGIGALAERLAPQYSVASLASASQILNLRVDSIPDLNAYFRVRSFLEQLTLVKKLSLVAIEQSSLLLQLQISGDAQALSKSISLGRLLAPNEAKPETPPEDPSKPSALPVLSYRYVQ